MMSFLNKYRKIITVILVLIPIFIFFWLLNNYFVFSGAIKTNYGFSIYPSIISDLYPIERTSNPQRDLKTKNIFQKIIAEPVYFDVYIPKMFEKAHIEFEYSAPDNAIIEIGVKKGPQDTAFEFKTLQNYYYDGLDESWNRIIDEEKKLILYQKGIENKEYNIDNTLPQYTYNYSDINAFLHNLPQESNIATYKFDLFDYQYIPNYKPLNNTQKIDANLFGSYEFYTYIKNEDLEFDFKFEDINETFGADYINIFVYQGNKLIYADLLEDNELTNDKTIKKDIYKLYIPDLIEGKYRIKIDTSDDIISNKITTKQKYLVFNKKINIAKIALENKKIELFHHGEIINIKPQSDNYFQDVFINNEKFSIISLNHEDNTIYLDNSNKVNEIAVKKGNISLSGNYFTFNDKYFFDPDFNMNINNLTGLTNIEKTNYIIIPYEKYTSPKLSGKWKKKSIDINIGNAFYEENKITFLISNPTKNIIHIKDIKVELSRISIWKSMLNKLKRK